MGQPKKLKIFVVDDDSMCRNAFKTYINKFGYEDVTRFINGNECLDKIHENPDIIFLDYEMGEENLSGYDVLKKIKRFNPNIYVVMLSGQKAIKSAVNTLKHGAFDYIQKGEPEEEEAKIKDVLERIMEMMDLLEREKPTLLKKIFKYF
ncbi:MAG: hypothetical protein B6D64_00050 [Bacteroidetes bacterium 4484_276]|nr:MAG: hypothetical protein B6D64_00050 [Bacteroidetes bacterium 4484_276]